MTGIAARIGSPERRARRRLLADRYGGNYLPVVCCLLLLYLLLAIADFDSSAAVAVLAILLAVLMPLGALGADVAYRQVWAGTVLSIIAAGLLAAGSLNDSDALASSGSALIVLLFLVLQFYTLRDVVRQPEVRTDTILGSVAAYLMLGLLWAYVYFILIQLDGDALAGHAGDPDPRLGEMLYFSVVTQTTLGYGDILPISGVARAIVQFEALFGQLYIAVLVAWIVGRLVSRREVLAESNGDAYADDSV